MFHTECKLSYIWLNFSPGTLDPEARKESSEERGFREEIRLKAASGPWKSGEQMCTFIEKSGMSK